MTSAYNTDDPNELLRKLRDAYHQILHGPDRTCNKLSFEELYTTAYKLCLYHRVYDQLYDIVKEAMIRYCDHYQTERLAKTRSTTEYLNCWKDLWSKYKQRTQVLSDLLMYLDRIRYMHDHPPVASVCFDVFWDHVYLGVMGNELRVMLLDGSSGFPSKSTERVSPDLKADIRNCITELHSFHIQEYDKIYF